MLTAITQLKHVVMWIYYNKVWCTDGFYPY